MRCPKNCFSGRNFSRGGGGGGGLVVVVVGRACSSESMYRNFFLNGGGCRVLCEGMGWAPDYSTADDVLGVSTNWERRSAGESKRTMARGVTYN